MSKANPDPKTTKVAFNLLWDMWNVLDDHDGYGNGNNYGTIISRYASIIDDRIENSGHSRSITSLKLFSDEQLQDELDERKKK